MLNKAVPQMGNGKQSKPTNFFIFSKIAVTLLNWSILFVQ